MRAAERKRCALLAFSERGGKRSSFETEKHVSGDRLEHLHGDDEVPWRTRLGHERSWRGSPGRGAGPKFPLAGPAAWVPRKRGQGPQKYRILARLEELEGTSKEL